MQRVLIAVLSAMLCALSLDVAAPVQHSAGMHQAPAGLAARRARQTRVSLRHRREVLIYASRTRPFRPAPPPPVRRTSGSPDSLLEPGDAATATHPRHARAPAPAPMTTIDIPRLGVVAPVREGAVVGGYLPIAPGYAVTHYMYSAVLGTSGNYVVYGHDDIEGGIFAHLGALQPGDRVYFRRGARRVTYVVTGSQVVSPGDVDVLDPTPSAMLTMISCTPLYVDTERIVVRATLLAL